MGAGDPATARPVRPRTIRLATYRYEHTFPPRRSDADDMRHPIRSRLYQMADMALAFSTLEAVRLPALPDAGEDDPAGQVGACTTAAAACTAPERARASRRADRARRTGTSPRRVARELS